MKKNLIHLISSNSWGGPEQYALDICRQCRLDGWRVRVVTKEAKTVDSRFSEAGISLRHAPLRDYPDIFSALILRNMLHRIPLNEGIIHVHSYHDALTAAIARRLARRPDIMIVATRHKAWRGKKSWLRTLVYKSIDRHVFVSEFAMQRFLSSWHEDSIPFDISNFYVAYNSLFLPEIPEKPLPEPGKGPVTAMFRGRIKPGKGLETLIDALSLVKDLRLRLRIVGTGDPDYVDVIRLRAQTRGVMEKIDWVKHDEDVLADIKDVHFGVFPSVEPEAFGMTNMEFMACGRPQISTMTGGQKEFLTDGVEALEVKPADAPSLALAMRRLATDPDLRSELGKNALDTYLCRLSWDHFINRIKNIYSS